VLDNALKYSPPQSPIQFCIVQREDLLGTSFTVTSQLAGTDFPDETIFARGERAGRVPKAVARASAYIS
jgi:signal transduction histidine kinase